MSGLVILVSGPAEDVEAEIAATFGPFVVLFGEDSADETDDRVAVGEDADHVGSPADFPVQPFLGVVGPDLPPQLLGVGGEGQDVGSGRLEVLGDAGQLFGEGVDDAVELGVHRGGVGLVVDRVEQRFHPAPGGLRADRHQVRRVVGAAALPGGAGQSRTQRRHQAAVGVGGHQADPGQAADGQVAEERQPAGAVLGVLMRRVTSIPRISRCPSAFTPVAVNTCTLTTRPPSRTFIVNASAARNV